MKALFSSACISFIQSFRGKGVSGATLPVPILPSLCTNDLSLCFHVCSGSEVKASAWIAGEPGFDPWVGKSPWRRKWQPTPVLLPGESHGGRSLVGYSPRGRKEVGYNCATSLSLSLSKEPHPIPSGESPDIGHRRKNMTPNKAPQP